MICYLQIADGRGQRGSSGGWFWCASVLRRWCGGSGVSGLFIVLIMGRYRDRYIVGILQVYFLVVAVWWLCGGPVQRVLFDHQFFMLSSWLV